MLRRDTPGLTILLGLLTALGPLSTDMYLPSLPAIGATLGASPAAVQLTLSAFLIGFAGGQLIHGPLSDRYGRRGPLLAALALYVAATLLCALAPTIELLITGRFLQALAASGPIVLARAVVRDLYEGPRAGRELARMGTIMGLVPAIAPILGGVIDAAAGWRPGFVAMALPGAAAFLAVFFQLPETIRSRDPAPISPLAILRGFGTLARSGSYRAHVGLLALTYGGLFAWISGSSFVLQGVYGLSGLGFALAFAIAVIGYIGGTLAAPPLVSRRGIGVTIGVGVVFLLAGGLVMLGLALLGPHHPASLVAPMAVYLFGVGLALPQTIAGALMPFPDRAGAASSLAGFIQMVTGAAIGIGVGQMIGDTAVPLAATIAAAGLSASTLYLMTRQTRAG